MQPLSISGGIFNLPSGSFFTVVFPFLTVKESRTEFHWARSETVLRDGVETQRRAGTGPNPTALVDYIGSCMVHDALPVQFALKIIGFFSN